DLSQRPDAVRRRQGLGQHEGRPRLRRPGDDRRAPGRDSTLTFRGTPPPMIGVGIALVILGLIFLFVIPWVGIPVGIVGVVLAVLWFAGFGRRAARGEQPTRPRP